LDHCFNSVRDLDDTTSIITDEEENDDDDDEEEEAELFMMGILAKIGNISPFVRRPLVLACSLARLLAVVIVVIKS